MAADSLLWRRVALQRVVPGSLFQSSGHGAGVVLEFLGRDDLKVHVQGSEVCGRLRQAVPARTEQGGVPAVVAQVWRGSSRCRC